MLDSRTKKGYKTAEELSQHLDRHIQDQALLLRTNLASPPCQSSEIHV